MKDEKKRNKVELTINLANQLPSDINKHTKQCY